MFCHVIRWKKNPLFESSSPDQLLTAEMLQFSESSPEFFGTRGPRTVGLFPTRHSLRNLAMINDRLAAHSFKQQSFPREKKNIVYKKRTFGRSLSVSTLQDYAVPSSLLVSTLDSSLSFFILHSFFILNVYFNPL